jgi:hypothetical protein
MDKSGDVETTLVQVVDAVAGACSQICVHLSEPLYDLVLNLVYDYASTNVRSNAVRAIHQLVECVANADPFKTMARFLPFACRNIRIELENGASSIRTTSSSRPVPSDATLHWSKPYDTLRSDTSWQSNSTIRSCNLTGNSLQVCMLYHINNFHADTLIAMAELCVSDSKISQTKADVCISDPRSQGRVFVYLKASPQEGPLKAWVLMDG